MKTRLAAIDILSALNLWTTHPLFLIPELRAVSGNLRQPEVKCFAALCREALDGAAADRLELGGCVRREA
ncbi:hypothetical protein, partial [Sutterella wadsworthensis]|uniref:hypothetical protein n=1 Tax=Sutterella wadsworthensis TaxID=40545 RepID=UPI0019D1FDA1